MPRTHQSLRRLYVAAPLAANAELSLDRKQSHYLATVLRMRVGEELVLFNGRDGAWLARIASADRKGVAVQPAEMIAPQPEPADLWYGFAPLKAARLDYLVQKATEMGACAIQPVLTRFTQIGAPKHERLVANAIEAAEQCEVLNLPVIEPPIGLDALLAGWREIHGDRRLVFADEGTPSASPLATLAGLEGARVGLLIGPEGGFAEDERQKLHAADFVHPISLGPRILRADTAAVAALAVIQASIGDWR